MVSVSSTHTGKFRQKAQNPRGNRLLVGGQSINAKRRRRGDFFFPDRWNLQNPAGSARPQPGQPPGRTGCDAPQSFNKVLFKSPAREKGRFRSRGNKWKETGKVCGVGGGGSHRPGRPAPAVPQTRLLFGCHGREGTP